MLVALLGTSCQTISTGSNWVDVDPSEANIRVTGLLKSGYIQKHKLQSNSSAIQEQLYWTNLDKRAVILLYELNSNSFFDKRMELSRVAAVASLKVSSFSNLSASKEFHNAVDLIEYATLKSNSDYCLVFSMAYGIKSYVTNTHPIGNRLGVGSYCQSTPIDDHSAKTFLSSFEIKNWTKYPEKSSPYLQYYKSSKVRESVASPEIQFSIEPSLVDRTARFIGSWENISNAFDGEVKLTKPVVNGQFSLTAPTLDIKCIGNWQTKIKGDGAAKPSSGSIQAQCSNGEKIEGVITTLKSGTGIVEGKDTKGQKVRISYN